jgi:hypothetical protein
MRSGSDDKKKKRLYVPPTLTKLPLEEAKQFVVERTKCSDQAATKLLESMREELGQKEEFSVHNGDAWKHSA